MKSDLSLEPNKLRQVLDIAKVGWWKADLYDKKCTFSDYILRLLGLPSEAIPFAVFRRMIREDYRELVTTEFTSIYIQETYEQTFPLRTCHGEIWVHAKLGAKEKEDNGHLIAWGSIQHITNPQIIDIEKIKEKFNHQLHQQNNISRSLLSFLKTEDTSEVILQILQNVLNQYHGSSAYIIEYDWKKCVQNCRFEVNAEGIASQIEKLTNLPLKDTPWWTEQITANKPILLNHLDELPQEACQEKEFLDLQNIKSLMVIPMIAQDHIWGYMGIDIDDQHRNWSQEDYQWFSTLGNIISICMELHKAKIKAQKEQEYFRNLYQHMPIGYIRIKLIYDAKGEITDYRFIELNPAFEKLTGAKISHLQGKTIRKLNLPHIDIDQQIREVNEIIRKKHFTQVNFQSPSRHQYFRCILYSPEQDEIVALFSDITDIQKAHEALDRSEKELRNIYRNIPVGIEIYDKNGYLRDMNPKDIEIFGLKEKSRGIGVNLFENPNIPEEVKQQIRDNQNVDFRIKYDFDEVTGYYQSDEQGVKDLSVKVSPLYNSENQLENYMLIIIDNTETTSAYSKIQEFENFFSVIADFAKVGYFKWNLCTKKGFALNQWFKNWGESEDSRLEDVIEHYRMLHPDDRPKIQKFYEQLYQGKITSLKEEVRVKNGPKGWKWIRTTVIVKKYDTEHRNIELIGVNFDITELKEIEAKLTEAKNKAETLDKLKSAFLANMSHEIRTPLNAIVGFSNLLAETNSPEEQQQYISIIQENNDLLLQLISDILDLSKIEAGTFEIVYSDVDVYTLCTEIVRSLSIKASNNVKLELEKARPDCHMKGDRNRLMQIITNFINNAFKFTSYGSIKLGYEVLEDQIEFYVRDTGVGIPSQNLHTVFDRFVKLNSFIHGTGLGLSICKSMVEQMGGQIGVESEEGKGSRFWFRLPFTVPDTPGTPEQTTSLRPSSSVTSSGKPCILIAEDTESNFILISTILKKEYQILWAHNGNEALEMYHKHHPDLILMDIRMPETDGLTATRKIRQEDSGTPVIALTAFAFNSDKARALEAGCNAYLSKPINAQELKATMRELLEQPAAPKRMNDE